MSQSDKVKITIEEQEIEVTREEAKKLQNAVTALEEIADVLQTTLGNIRTQLTEKSNGSKTTGHGDN